MIVELDLVDVTRPTATIGAVPAEPSRRLPTTVYLPESEAAAPLIVLAHGFNGHPRKFSDLATHWAGAGYLVAVPRFPVTSDEFGDTSEEADRKRFSEVEAQALDVAFVADSVLVVSRRAGHALAGRVDPERLGLYGLSLGALTVWEAATVLGSRVDALIQSDGDLPAHMEASEITGFPVLIAHSDVDPIFDIAGVLAEFRALTTPTMLMVLHGAAHAAVGENTITPADAAYREATTVFWQRYLDRETHLPFPASLDIEGVTTFIDSAG